MAVKDDENISRSEVNVLAFATISMNRSLKSWILAARPKTLPAAVAPVWAGCVLAWVLTGEWSWWLAVCTLLSASAIQIATNFFNDAVDYRKGADTAARLGPTRVTASGMLSEGAVMWIACGFLLVACVLAIPLIAARGWPILAIGVPSLYFSFGYTGGPLPLAYRGLGELFVMLFFGLIAVTGTTFVQTGDWHIEAVVLGLQIGAISTALIGINNLRDVDEDRTTNKRTLAVRMGETFARAEISALFALAILLGGYWLLAELRWMALLPSAIALPGAVIVMGVWKNAPSARYNRYLALCGMSLLLFALLFQVAAVLDQSAK